MKNTKTLIKVPTVNPSQITDVASLFIGQPAYEEALYDNDAW
jgi:hypothetical protein